MYILSGCGWLPAKTINIIHIAYNVVRMAIPAIIVVMGSIDFLKSIASASDDEIRKNTNNFIHKLIGAAIAFIIPAAVGWIAQVMADSNASQGVTCMNAMLNGTYTADQGLPDQGQAKNEQQQKELANCKANCGGNQACIEACDGKINVKNYESEEKPQEYIDCYDKCLQEDPTHQSDYNEYGFYAQSLNECMAALNPGDDNSKIVILKREYDDCIDKNPGHAENCKEISKEINEITQKYNGTSSFNVDNYDEHAYTAYDINNKACQEYASQQQNSFKNNSLTLESTCDTYCHQERDYTNVK